jgi:nicotinamide/nicotinate riboside kinase
MHPELEFQDWDSPEGAIEWDRQREAIRYLREKGKLPEQHASHDHLNEQKPVPIDERIQKEWKEKFIKLFEDEKQEKPSVLLFFLFLLTLLDRDYP